ncbi:MAG: glycosyltransferase family 2 protein [Flavobacteriaceae bacterium]|nr:glycosyltransferase family 2 protein [Flavobacteriaceae bacterium]
MKVSLITATFNSNQYLQKCIESVNCQSYSDIQHVFIDGGSSDSTLDTIYKTSTRNPMVISEPDHGLYDAINKGISQATGDIIGLIHSDDFLASPKIIFEIVNVFQRNDCDGVYGDLQYVRANNPDRVVRFWKSQDFQKDFLSQGWMPPHPTLFLKENIFADYGNYNLNLTIAADYDFILRIFSKENLKFCYVPEIITVMRLGGASNRSLSNIIRKSREDFYALKQNQIARPIKALLQKNLSKLSQFYSKK